MEQITQAIGEGLVSFEQFMAGMQELRCWKTATR